MSGIQQPYVLLTAALDSPIPQRHNTTTAPQRQYGLQWHDARTGNVY